MVKYIATVLVPNVPDRWQPRLSQLHLIGQYEVSILNPSSANSFFHSVLNTTMPVKGPPY